MIFVFAQVHQLHNAALVAQLASQHTLDHVYLIRQTLDVYH